MNQAMTDKTTKGPRAITTDLFKLLDLARLTWEDQGTTGAMIREWIFEAAGWAISEEEIAQYVKHTLDVQLQTHLKDNGLSHDAWVAKWEAANPGQKWEDADDGEEDYLTDRVKEVVDLMVEERQFELNLRSQKKGNTQ